MKLARELLTVRRALAFGIVGLTTLANLLTLEAILAATAWLSFLLLVIVYLFDIAYYSVGRKG